MPLIVIKKVDKSYRSENLHIYLLLTEQQWKDSIFVSPELAIQSYRLKFVSMCKGNSSK